MLRFLGLFALLSLVLAAPAGAAESTVAYGLAEGVTAELGRDGALVLTDPAVDDAPRLVTAWPWPDTGRRSRPGPAFLALAAEGDPGGRRGFSASADDDGDGRTDEDPLDGRDNDGDGRTDEDFAAVSHRMGVWDQSRQSLRRRVETYHWAWPNLQTLVVARFQQTGADAAEPVILHLTDRTDWWPLDDACLGADAPAAGPVFLAPAAAPRGRWLGVVVLGEPPRSRGERIVNRGDELQVPLRDGEVSVAFAAGATRLQVIDDLAAAVQLHRGMTDPVSGRRVAWLPAAVPPAVPATRLPRARLQVRGPDAFDLSLTVTPTQLRRFDPDLFRLGDRPLGTPRELVWEPDGEPGRTLAWPEPPGVACDPHAVLATEGAGTLMLRFSGRRPAISARLTAVLADGRAADLDLEVVAPDSELTRANDPRTLSPRLLSTFPNPFRAATRVRFEVPTTAGEAFDWEGEGAPPFDPRERLPFASGSAAVSVRIYGLEGTEIATLFAARVGPGVYEAGWDGRDRLGRTVASGTYICKLQIEKYSVTKQLVFVR